MSSITKALFGGGGGSNGQFAMMQAQQRRTLAEQASQQAQIDMAGAPGGGKRGSQMLTFLQRGGDVLGGSSKFGSA